MLIVEHGTDEIVNFKVNDEIIGFISIRKIGRNKIKIAYQFPKYIQIEKNLTEKEIIDDNRKD